MLNYLESQIPTGRFIFGDFMMADLSIASPSIECRFNQFLLGSPIKNKT